MFDTIHAQEFAYVGDDLRRDFSALDFPSVLREHVHGCRMRVRIGCSTCNAASDNFEWEDLVCVRVGEARDQGPIGLRSLWQKRFSECEAPRARCPGERGGCGRPDVHQQFFLEREPNVLILSLIHI